MLMKMINKNLKNGVLFVCSLLASTLALADWQLQKPSEVTFVSSKNSHLLEIHRFNQISGTVSATGEARVVINLSSIDSKIQIRDQRMREQLFEVSQFADAEILARLTPDALALVKAGEVQTINLDATLSLHGNTEKLSIPVIVAPAKDDKLVISNLAPVLIHANDFALTQGVQALQKIAKLKVISEVVPVNFVLTFSKNTAD